MLKQLATLAAIATVAALSLATSQAAAQCGVPDCCEPCVTTCAPCTINCEPVDKKTTIYASECTTVCIPRLCLVGGLRDLIGLSPSYGACGPCQPAVCEEAACCGEPTCGPCRTPLFGMTCGKPHVKKILLMKKVPCGTDLKFTCEPCGAGGPCDPCSAGDADDMPVDDAETAEPAPAAKAAVAVPPVPRPVHGAMLIAPLPAR